MGPALEELSGLLFTTGLVLFLPGFAWQAWFPQPEKSWTIRWADALALSLSANALLALLLFYLNIQLSSKGLWAAAGVLILAWVTGLWLRREPGAQHTRRGWEALLLTFLIAGGVSWRLVQSNGLAMPPWVDSIHHVMIVRAILLHGGLPASLDPFLPVPFYYHFSFHTAAASVAAFSRLPVEQVVLVFGQVLNGLIGLAVYRLSFTVWKNWRSALLAALLAVFFSQKPGYFLSWGRYTLLAGLLLLPPGLSAAWEVMERPDGREAAVRLAVLGAGTLLSHYLAALLLALGGLTLAAHLAFRQARDRRWRWQEWVGLAAGGSGALLLSLPWLLRVFHYSREYFRVSTAGLGSDMPAVAADYIHYLGQLLGPAHNYALWGLGLSGLYLALRSARSRWLALWGLLIALLTVPWGLRLGPFSPHHYAMVLFLPAVLLAANLLASAVSALPEPLGLRAKNSLVVVLALGIITSGMFFTRDVVNPVTILASEADLQALEWIEDNLSEDARFFINTTYWQDGWYRGVDGGAWILTLTGRWILQPPPFFAFGPPDYVQQVTGWAERGSQLRGCDLAFWDLVRETKITHLYLHAGRGALQAETLSGCGGLIPIYSVDGVSLLEVVE